MCRAQERPIACKETTEQGELGSQQKHYLDVSIRASNGMLGILTARDSREYMSDRIEKEEL